MDSPMTWLIIILVVLVVAAALWMLLRRPGSGDGGGRHEGHEGPVVGRDEDVDRTATAEGTTDTATGTPPAGAAPTTPTAQEGSGEAPFDQEAPRRSELDQGPRQSELDEEATRQPGLDHETQQEPGPPEHREATYTDTASGATRSAEDDDPHTARLAEPAPPGGAAEGTDVGHPGPTSQHPGEASYTEEPLAPAEPEAPEGHPGRESQRPEQGAYAEPVRHPVEPETTQQEGHPGRESQPPGAATAPVEPEGHPGRESQTAVTEEAPAPEHSGPDHSGPDHSEPDHSGHARHEPSTEQAPPAQPYGPGSAAPAADGSGPAGWEVKGNTGSMLFHTPDSPSYEGTLAEVWFESEEAARAAGFAHWDRKRR